MLHDFERDSLKIKFVEHVNFRSYSIYNEEETTLIHYANYATDETEGATLFVDMVGDANEFIDQMIEDGGWPRT